MNKIPNDIKFVTGAELECIFVSPEDTDAIAKYHRDGFRQLTFDNQELLQGVPSTRDEVLENIQITKDLARRQQEELLKFEPQSLYEQSVRSTWANTNVDTWGPTECINYMLYENSTPKLGKLSLPLGSTYSQTIAAGHELFEYRFGTGINQTGYYDSSGIVDGKLETVSEFRINPHNHEYLLGKEYFATQQIAAAAMYFWQLAFLSSTHYTISHFQGERPVLGDMQMDITPYKAALGGLLLASREQALVHSGTVLANAPHRFYASPWRDGVMRIMPLRLEYRAANQRGTASSPMALRFITAGLKYAIAHPEIAADEDISEIDVVQAKATEKHNIEHDTDVELTSAIQSCCINPNTKTLKLVRNLDAGNIPEFLSGFIGRLPNLTGRQPSNIIVAVADFLETCIGVESSGRLALRQKTFIECCFQNRFNILDINMHDLQTITTQLEKVRVSENRKSLIGEVVHPQMDMDEIIHIAEKATVLPQVDPKGHTQHLQELRELRTMLKNY